MFLSGWISNNQITAIFYQVIHRDIQNGINLGIWDWYSAGLYS